MRCSASIINLGAGGLIKQWVGGTLARSNHESQAMQTLSVPCRPWPGPCRAFQPFQASPAAVPCNWFVRSRQGHTGTLLQAPVRFHLKKLLPGLRTCVFAYLPGLRTCHLTTNMHTHPVCLDPLRRVLPNSLFQNNLQKQVWQ